MAEIRADDFGLEPFSLEKLYGIVEKHTFKDRWAEDYTYYYITMTIYYGTISYIKPFLRGWGATQEQRKEVVWGEEYGFSR